MTLEIHRQFPLEPRKAPNREGLHFARYSTIENARPNRSEFGKSSIVMYLFQDRKATLLTPNAASFKKFRRDSDGESISKYFDVFNEVVLTNKHGRYHLVEEDNLVKHNRKNYAGQ